MAEWLHTLLEKVQNQNDKRAAWLDGYSPIFIYGTGTMAQDIHQVLSQKGLPVIGFLDHLVRENPFLLGMPIFKPESDKLAAMKGKKPTVILGIHNNQADISNIINNLNDQGFHHILSPVELYDSFGDDLGNRFWLTSRKFYLPLEFILGDLLELWFDTKSKSLYQSILEFRLTGDVSYLPQPDLVNIYHPEDIPAWQMPLRIIDCGAFDGDTLADFIKNHFNIAAAAAFEPDLTNFKNLSQFAMLNQDSLPDISLWPCGVFSSATQLTFTSGMGTSSNISDTGTTVIQCIALDDALRTFNPNLIKMDIEGAEYDALLGARELISTFTPGLAISLYHRPEHLWQLPYLVERMAPGKYQFFLRSHALNDFELFLYAIPRKRNN